MNYFNNSQTNSNNKNDINKEFISKTSNKISLPDIPDKNKNQFKEYQSKKNNLIELSKYKTVKVKQVIRKYEIKN